MKEENHKPSRCPICQYITGLVQQYQEFRQDAYKYLHCMYISPEMWGRLKDTLLVEVTRDTRFVYEVQVGNDVEIYFYWKGEL